MKEELTHIAHQILSLAGVAAFYYLLRTHGDVQVLRSIPAVAASFSPALAAVFERHVWQFVFSMAALTVVSRGNLWSCGINSMHVRRSLAMLLWFYGAAIVVLGMLSWTSVLAGDAYGSSRTADKLLVMVIHWLSSPVADQILFFGLFQTMLAKYWTAEVAAGSLRLPAVIFITALIFALGRVELAHYTTTTAEYACAYGIGFFSGIVYHRTRSLLTPMLAQAFFFGLPDVIYLFLSSIG